MAIKNSDVSEIIQFVKILEGQTELKVEDFAYNEDPSIFKAEHGKYILDNFHGFTITFYQDGTCRFAGVDDGLVFHELVSEYVMDLWKVLGRGTIELLHGTHNLTIEKYKP